MMLANDEFDEVKFDGMAISFGNTFDAHFKC